MKKITIVLIILLSLSCLSFTSAKATPFLIVGHRGDMTYAPEHTLPSYQRAISQKADFIEIDLRLTKDNKIVSIHDETVDRTSNGKGKVFNLTLKQLKSLDFGSWYNKKYKGEKILTLEEIFKKYKNTTKYYIEVRDVNGKLLMEKQLVDLVKKYKLENKVIIQSFSADSLKKVHKLNPKLKIVQLIYEKEYKKFNLSKVSKYADGIGIGVVGNLVTKKFVRDVHAKGLTIHLFFMKDEKKLMKKMIPYGIDGVFSNDLTDTKKLAKQFNRK